MVQGEVNEEIPLVTNDVEPDLIDVDLVDPTITQHTYFQDEEVDVSEDEEDAFSDRESSIDSFDWGLEEDDSENDSCKRGLTRGLQSLHEQEKNPNVKPFAAIAEDMPCIAEWNFPSEVEGVDVARAVELQYMMLFRGWRYRLREEHFAGKAVIEAIKNNPPEVWGFAYDFNIFTTAADQ
ncbi:hypothetical protein Cgig2_029704 [Carnegiea gigantea]|uniref:Uncharacterized protein n=1 Tax=Carnegiea gigantea TaxID=171969 RepID=A0A9Q1KK48_9CARY|nr:hypothetical protein Cgig2_029704 [Carnegiea gigantea]